MPFKDTDEGQTHYYGDGCTEHPAKMNLREVIEKTAEQLYNNLPHFENLAAAEEMARYVTRQVLDAIIEEVEKEQKWLEQCIDRNFGDNIFADGSLAQATRIRMLLKQAREDITSLQ